MRCSESQTIGRLAAMSADEFADGLMAGTLGGSGESLDPLTRTVLSLSLEHIPVGFGNVSSVVEHVKHALRRHVGAQFKSGKSGDEVTATLMRKVNYESHETITFLEAIRIGYCGIDVAGSNRADPRAAISDVRAARLFEGSPMSTTEYAMPVTALAVQLNTTGLCSYRPVFGGVGRRGAYALLTKQCKNDLNAIHAEFIKNIGVPFADPEPLFLNPTSMLHYMWSDSSRSKNPKDFSGMGGFCALTGLAWYWEYDDAEREGMQIRVHQYELSVHPH